MRCYRMVSALFIWNVEMHPRLSQAMKAEVKACRFPGEVFLGMHIKKKLITQSKKIITQSKKINYPIKKNNNRFRLSPLVCWSSGLWSFGPWSSGPLVLWSLVFWPAGPLVLWSASPLVLWSAWSSGLWSPGPVLVVGRGFACVSDGSLM